jgi:hypothetical protein
MDSRLVQRSFSKLFFTSNRGPIYCYRCFHKLQRNYSVASHARTKQANIQPSPAIAPNSSSTPELRAIDRLDQLLKDALDSLRTPKVPSEATILEALTLCHDLARYFKEIKDKPAISTIKPGNAAGNLLFLDSEDLTSTQKSPIALGKIASSIAGNAADKISDTVFKIAEDQNVFITANILRQIVETQALLGRPESLARVFNLYAKKPIPVPDSFPIRYNKPAPTKIGAAIPLNIVHSALDAAIKVRNLPLCLDIIDHTVCTKAFRKAKFVQKALIPTGIVALTPLAAYSLASQISTFQDSMSTSTMTAIGTAGIMTYFVATGTMGMIALTTANDHMDRVTWASGTPLRERWIKEDERALLDKVAGAWGFKDSRRRGEEEGPEWDALKELIGIRGMVLDRVELMEGME